MENKNIPEQEDTEYKIPFNELEALYNTFIVRLDLSIPEMERTGGSVFYGFHKNWTLPKIVNHYNLNQDLAAQAWSAFNFKKKDDAKRSKTRSKKEVIVNYLKVNTGQIVTPAQVSEKVGVSLPTFYNFYNSNRHFFKKTGRGQFQILDPEVERSKDA